MDNNYSQKKLLFLLFIPILLFFDPAVTEEQTQAALEIEESEEFENSLVRNVRDGYQNGFVKVVNFINSINDTLAALNKKMEVGFAALNEKISRHDTVLSEIIGQLPLTSSLRLKRAYKFNKLEAVNDFIRGQAKEINTGKSFNGSTLSDIQSGAAQVGLRGWHSVIVFVNHLDEAIGDFTIYEYYNMTYNPAPNTVPGRTQEVFTFASPRMDGGAMSSFSYEIPSFKIRVAAISLHGTYGVGLAFVPEGADMKTYYESHKGIEGSTVWETGGHKDRNLFVGYKNLYARISAHHEEKRNNINYAEKYKTTLRIELIKLPLDD